MLLRALSDLSSEAQVIISTHTPVLARGLSDSSLRYVHVCPNNDREIFMGGADTNARCAQALGVIPDNSVRLFIAVEGPNDIAFLQTISTALRIEDNSIPDLVKLELDGEVIFIPLGGSTLALWSSRLANLNRPEFHLCDRDIAPPAPARYAAHIAAVNNRPHCRARSTEKKELENYLHRDVIIAAYQECGTNLTIEANFHDFDDVPREVAHLVHVASGSPRAWNSLTEEEKDEKESKVKRMLCTRGARNMTLARLADIDADNDLLSWFHDIQELLA